ncbi:hypothetical protein HN51_039395 [Arachis hypogaea]|uniref:Uncharacterized protein n=1 Tax=Arachis hypogaea TaxID=3818 RepID=A0A444YIX3_ARAHY|nr:short-chain dehydrogenase reductase 3b [Arachis ipaensis]XP_025662497.1 short-chain dehydrogenase reductase 3b [Arachis hypogaea]QHN84916.1 Short-chain dehydrogenase reductase 3b [Arachis hypogaea]RYR01896.1 hypothetical protein Ahy_B06g080761 [Arachis hypogaea]
MSMQRLEGKVAIVTGGASGIGAETVKLFAKHGACVVIADIQDDLGKQVATSIGTDKVSYRHCDVRDEKQVEETVAFTVEKYGGLDIMFSNAGVAGSQSNVLDMDLNDFDNTIAVNLRGYAVCIKHAARVMVARKTRGSIICTASTVATVSVGGFDGKGYVASKSGILGLVRSTCGDLGEFGIRVNSISPYLIATPLATRVLNLDASEVEEIAVAGANLKGIVLKPIHIAQAALFLASDESAYISGHDMVVDGGFLGVNKTFGFILKEEAAKN